MKAEPNLEVPQVLAQAIYLRVDPEPIEWPALQLVIQTVPLAQKTRILPAELIPPARVPVGQVRIHPGKHDVELIQLGSKLAKIGFAVFAALVANNGLVPSLIRLS